MTFLEAHRRKVLAGDIERLRSKLDGAAARALLDVGGGTGAITEAIASGIRRVVVVEPDAARRRRGAKRRPGIEFLAGSAHRLPVPDDAFDRVVSFVAFHHFPDQAAALAEMRRVLRPGGRLLLFEFRPERAPGRMWRLLVGHTHFVEPEELLRMAAEAGFHGGEASNTPTGYLVVATR